MSIKIAQLQNFSLAGSGVSISDTSMTLSSFQTIDGVNLAMSDFGSIGYMTLEPGSRDREEQISFTGITQNSSGTATLTGIKTVLFLSPYTETSGFSKSHPGGVIAVVTNTSGFYNQFGIKQNNDILTGFWEAPDPLTAQGVATKNYVDNLVNGGTVTTNALIEVGIAGETVLVGQVLYLKIADGRWWKADATTVATIFNVQLGIAQGGGTAGVNITGGVLIKGIDTHQSAISAGALYYVRDGGGLPSSSAGTISRIIGNGGTSATLLAFDPEMYAETRQASTTTASSLVVTNASGNIDGTFSLQPTYKKFFISGTWSKPTGLKYVIVEGVGAGGGGGGGGDGATSQAGGGGAGGYAKKMIVAATLGATETVTIGALGAGGTPPGAGAAAPGAAGGTTSFGTHISCTGGSGGAGAMVTTGNAGGAPGVGSNGDVNTTGGPGVNGGGGNSGAGGSGYFGGGGRGSTGNVDGQAAGQMAGGGGGGSAATSSHSGGAGTAGYVGVLEVYL